MWNRIQSMKFVINQKRRRKNGSAIYRLELELAIKGIHVRIMHRHRMYLATIDREIEEGKNQIFVTIECEYERLVM
jgi:hypothetical protein